MLKIIIAVAALWTGAGLTAYSQCMSQYHAKWPASVWDTHTSLIRRTCIVQGVFPITGLPIVLMRGSEGPEGKPNNWQWFEPRWK